MNYFKIFKKQIIAAGFAGSESRSLLSLRHKDLNNFHKVYELFFSVLKIQLDFNSILGVGLIENVTKGARKFVFEREKSKFRMSEDKMIV